MERWKIIHTTDGKNIGRTYTVPYVNTQIAWLMSGKRFWFDRLIYTDNGKRLILLNPNYKVTLNRIN